MKAIFLPVKFQYVILSYGTKISFHNERHSMELFCQVAGLDSQLSHYWHPRTCTCQNLWCDLELVLFAIVYENVKIKFNFLLESLFQTRSTI